MDVVQKDRQSAEVDMETFPSVDGWGFTSVVQLELTMKMHIILAQMSRLPLV